MSQSARRLLMILSVAACLPVRPGSAQANPHGGAAAPREASAPSPYAPYTFLIGDWDISPEGQPPTIVFRFIWGPKQSYIWCVGSLLEAGKEVPHFEGMLVWNAARKNLDMLFALGMDGSGLQEQGSMFVDKDGSIVREITAVGPQGSQHFRQTFKAERPDRVITSVMRETKDGWKATFPGSERLVMSRRPAAPEGRPS